MDSIYIVSAKRPVCKTAKTLEKIGISEYTIVIDEDDECAEEYFSNYGEKVKTYSYKQQMQSTDMLDNFLDNIGGAAPARNGVLTIAMDNGDKYCWMLDDDISSFTVPKPNSDSRKIVKSKAELVNAFEKIERMRTMFGAFVVAGVVDMQRFPPDRFKWNVYARQCFNVCVGAVPKFRSRMEEDYAFSIDCIRNGLPVIAFNYLGFKCSGVCEDEGGCTTIYEKNGTVRRAAYSVLYCPNTSVRKDRFGWSGFPRFSKFTPTFYTRGI